MALGQPAPPRDSRRARRDEPVREDEDARREHAGTNVADDDAVPGRSRATGGYRYATHLI